MKKSVVIVFTILAVILIGNVIVAYAQNGNPPAPNGAGVCPNGYTCPFSGTMPYGGMMGGRGGRGMMGNPQAYGYMMGQDGMHQAVMTAVANALGMTYDQLTAALQTQTLAQIAAAKGVSADTLRQAAATARNAELDRLVQQGVITQAQADWMKSRMQTMPLYGLDNDGACPMQNGQGGWQNNGQSGSYGPGMMGGRGGMMGRGYARPAYPQG